jgi:hypothetical protein
LIVLGRYIPQLKFLEVVLGDEPVLTPAQRFYQRLLATDQEEARTIAETHLKENSLESLYESIFIPALRLVEQDYQTDVLDEDSRRYMFRSTKTLIEDLGAQLEETPPTREGSYARRNWRVGQAPKESAKVACIPARSGPDELVAMMLAQLLRHAGFHARQLKAGELDDMLAEVSQHDYTVICVSAVAPFAIAQARTLCKRLQASDQGLQIIVGLWDFEGGADKARERLGAGCPAVVATKLSEELDLVRGGLDSAPATEILAEQGKP